MLRIQKTIYDEEEACICEVCNDVAIYGRCIDTSKFDEDYFVCSGCQDMLKTISDEEVESEELEESNESE